MEAEFIGIEGFQGVAVVMGQAGEAAGDAPGTGIMDDGIHGILQIAPADGEEVHTALIKLGEKYKVVPVKSGSLPSPQEKIGEIVFTAPFAAVH